MDQSPPIFICGATGAQGGQLAALLKTDRPIHTISRNASSPAAIALLASAPDTIRVFQGSYDDQDLLLSALKGCSAVFLNTMPFFEANKEVNEAKRIIQAAHDVETVKHFIYSSVCMTGRHTSFPGWESASAFDKLYWESKAEIERLVAEAGFQHHLVLRPAFFMQNLLPPKVNYMFPGFATGGSSNSRLLTLFTPETKLMFVDVGDIARFVVAALKSPDMFNDHAIELGGEEVTMDGLAVLVGKEVPGTTFRVEYVSTVEQALEEGYSEGVARAQKWQREVGYQVDVKGLEERYGIRMTRIAEFLANHRDEVRATYS
ncbi:hypothetical protein BKA64DRAFT_659679 [Cadophora sp. MPI-SDFR-AT-0126]|nr:hypothetical protein BKA64DRAFT_659679 [Leotiomycetes sp. MPI-SDFR-AT-0126]